MLITNLCANVVINPAEVGMGIHFIALNLAIGILEGLCLGFLFKLPKWKTIGWMVLANYASSWIGGPFLQKIISTDIEPSQVGRYIITIIIAAYLLTLLLEFPFVYLACKSKLSRWEISIWGSLVIQTVSYSLLVAFWYYPLCSMSILKSVDWVNTTEFIKNTNAVMYYIDSTGKNVHRMNLDGTNNAPIITSGNSVIEELTFEYNKETKTADIVAVSNKNYTVISSVLNEVEYEIRNNDRFRWSDSPEDLRNTEERSWDVFGSVYVIRIINSSTGQKINLRLNIPFLDWQVFWLTILPCDEMVFQFGSRICLYSRPENKMIILAKGSSPVVFLEDPMKKQNNQ
jgi:hypothetical protein